MHSPAQWCENKQYKIGVMVVIALAAACMLSELSGIAGSAEHGLLVGAIDGSLHTYAVVSGSVQHGEGGRLKPERSSFLGSLHRIPELRMRAKVLTIDSIQLPDAGGDTVLVLGLACGTLMLFRLKGGLAAPTPPQCRQTMCDGAISSVSAVSCPKLLSRWHGIHATTPGRCAYNVWWLILILQVKLWLSCPVTAAAAAAADAGKEATLDALATRLARVPDPAPQNERGVSPLQNASSGVGKASNADASGADDDDGDIRTSTSPPRSTGISLDGHEEGQGHGQAAERSQETTRNEDVDIAEPETVESQRARDGAVQEAERPMQGESGVQSKVRSPPHPKSAADQQQRHGGSDSTAARPLPAISPRLHLLVCGASGWAVVYENILAGFKATDGSDASTDPAVSPWLPGCVTSVECADVGTSALDAATAASATAWERDRACLPYSTRFDGVLCATVVSALAPHTMYMGDIKVDDQGNSSFEGEDETAAAPAGTEAGSTATGSRREWSGRSSGSSRSLPDFDSETELGSERGADGAGANIRDRAELYVGTFHGAVLGYHAVERWVDVDDDDDNDDDDQYAARGQRSDITWHRSDPKPQATRRCRLEVSLRSVTHVQAGRDRQPVVALRVLDVLGDGVEDVVAATRYGLTVMQRDPVAVDAAMSSVLARLGEKIRAIEGSPPKPEQVHQAASSAGEPALHLHAARERATARAQELLGGSPVQTGRDAVCGSDERQDPPLTPRRRKNSLVSVQSV